MAQPEIDILIAGGTVADGSGEAPRKADVAVSGERIVAIEPDLGGLAARERVDATGCTVTPGIIDIHSHADWTLTFDSAAESALLQGISTVVPGNCGHGVAPVGDSSLIRFCAFGYDRHTETDISWQSFGEWLARLRASEPAVNIAPLIAHGAVRMATMGSSLALPSDDELHAMRRHIEEAMESGAVGLSSGLEYQPGQSATQTEVSMLAEVVGAHKGLYATHCRNRTGRIEQAAVESIDIAASTDCRLQLSHFVVRPHQPDAPYLRCLERLSRARDAGMQVYCDTLPLLYGPAPIAMLLPDWAWHAGANGIPKLLREPASRKRMLDGLDPRFQEWLASGLADAIVLSHTPGTKGAPGHSLGAWAGLQAKPTAEVAMDLLADAGADFYAVTGVDYWVTPEALDRAMADETFLFMGDAITLCADGGLSHWLFSHSDWNWVPEVIYRHVGERGILSLESAVRRMTSLAARQLGLAEVGELRPGWRADVAVFEPRPIARPSDDDSLAPFRQMSECVRLLLVGGTKAVEGSAATGLRGGRVGRG